MGKPGRPTKYCDALLEAAEAYLENYEAAGDLVPSVVGLALAIGIDKSTCYEWAKHEDKARFSDILTRVEAIQEQQLLRGGLGNEFNPAITKMMLTKHGYSDKIEQSHTSPDGSMSPPSAFIIEGVAPDDDSTTD